MTIRQFVERGAVGTHQEREAFETGLLEAFARAAERGEQLTPPDRDVPEDFWIMTFGYAKLTLARAGHHLGARRA